MNETQVFDKLSLLRLTFEGVAEEELQEIAASTRLCTYPAGHVLCHEGAYEDVFYILAEGSAVVSKIIGPQDGERMLRMVGKGDLIGEMALIQNSTRAATVRAASDCTVLEMDKQDFDIMLNRSPSMAVNIIRTTLDRMRENDRAAIQYLQETNKVLRQLDRNKLEFIQVAAHELRTPLTVIRGYVDVLRSFPDLGPNAALTGVLDGIRKGVGRMLEVVNTMLDVTRIDSETLKLRLSPTPLKRMIQDAVQDFAEAASGRDIELLLDLDADTPIIHADPTLLQKALAHLIVNAIKYTPDGGKVTVGARPVTLEGGVPGVQISVSDTGIGLDVEHHELIFEKFYQVGDVSIHSSGKTTFKGGGPGLGLAIVRGVARAHGGRVWVESAGHDEVNFPGCTFYLQLPVEPA
ncbi:MAG: ATP-binding protein [Chloroflexota bacterium]